MLKGGEDQEVAGKFPKSIIKLDKLCAHYDEEYQGIWFSWQQNEEKSNLLNKLKFQEELLWNALTAA